MVENVLRKFHDSKYLDFRTEAFIVFDHVTYRDISNALTVHNTIIGISNGTILQDRIQRSSLPSYRMFPSEHYSNQ